MDFCSQMLGGVRRLNGLISLMSRQLLGCTKGSLPLSTQSSGGDEVGDFISFPSDKDEEKTKQEDSKRIQSRKAFRPSVRILIIRWSFSHFMIDSFRIFISG